MQRDLMDILACPRCKGALTIAVTHEADGEILSGALQCPACDVTYPIEDGIPNLLPLEVRDTTPLAAPSGSHE